MPGRGRPAVPRAAPAGAHAYDFKSLYRSLGYPSADFFASSEDEVMALEAYIRKEDPIYGEINGYLRYHPQPYEWYGTGPEDAKVIVGHIDNILRRAPRLPGDLPHPVAEGCYRIAREAIANSARHSGVCAAELDLDWLDGAVRIAVRDAGRGFDPTALGVPQLDGGFGLFSIRERITELGGTVTVAAARDAGCAVVIVVPTTRPGRP